MTKMMDQFLRHWIIGWRLFSWFNISPSSLLIGMVLVDEVRKSRFCGFALAFVIALQNHLHSVLTYILRTASQRFPALCRLGVRDQLVQAMRNSDP